MKKKKNCPRFEIRSTGAKQVSCSKWVCRLFVVCLLWRLKNSQKIEMQEIRSFPEVGGILFQHNTNSVASALVRPISFSVFFQKRLRAIAQIHAAAKRRNGNVFSRKTFERSLTGRNGRTELLSFWVSTEFHAVFGHFFGYSSISLTFFNI